MFFKKRKVKKEKERKMTNEEKRRADAQREEARKMSVLIRNVVIYDGTGRGQEKID